MMAFELHMSHCIWVISSCARQFFQKLFTWSQEQVDPGAWQSQDEPAQHLLASRFAHRPTSIGPCIRPDKPFRSLATSRKRSSNRPRDGSPPGRVKASDSPAVRHSVLKDKSNFVKLKDSNLQSNSVYFPGTRTFPFSYFDFYLIHSSQVIKGIKI